MEYFNTDRAPKAIGPYSQAVKAGNILFISGQIPIDPATGILQTGSIEKLTELVLNNLSNIITDAGFDLKNVAKVTVFLKNIGNFEKVNNVYSKFFKEYKPSRAVVEVSNLPKGAEIEIEAVCVKD